MVDIFDLYNMCPDSEEEYLKIIKEKFSIPHIESFSGAVLFGTENMGKNLLRNFKKLGIGISSFSDNNKNKWEKIIEDIPVIKPQELKHDELIIIASQYVKEIYNQLLSSGFKRIIPYYVLNILYPEYFPYERHKRSIKEFVKKKEKILEVYKRLSDSLSKDLYLQILKFRITLSVEDLPFIDGEEYFPGDFWKLEEEETYIDTGAYNGDTLKQFLKHTKGRFRKYIALEPDKKNYEELLKNIPEIYKDRVIPLQIGAGDKKEIVKFSSCGDIASMISENGEDNIEVISLDELCRNESVTTIKIDVEGYEPQVLKGAKNIIKHRPKLAVSVYHTPCHLWDLPGQVIDINPDYELYLRHHEPDVHGTVLYAI